jgi:hypothetical protein
MKGEGVDIQRTTWEEIGESISDIGSGIFTIWKWGAIIGMTIVGLVLLRIFVELMKNPNKTIQGAMLLTPQGRAVAGAKAITGN